MNVMENLVRDVRYAVRTLARTPGFTAAALLALAIGIGANTAVFSVVNGVLLRRLPYPEPDQLVWIQDGLAQSSRSSRWGACVADFLLWRSRSRSFDALAAWTLNSFNVTGDGEAERVTGLAVTARFFDVLRVRPLRGRTFAPDEDQSGRRAGHSHQRAPVGAAARRDVGGSTPAGARSGLAPGRRGHRPRPRRRSWRDARPQGTAVRRQRVGRRDVRRHGVGPRHGRRCRHADPPPGAPRASIRFPHCARSEGSHYTLACCLM